MKRVLLSVENYHFDVSLIDCVYNARESDDDTTIFIKYNGVDCKIECKDQTERKTIYKSIVDGLVESKMVLLYDNERDLINFSNVILFENPVFDKTNKTMEIKYKFKDNSEYMFLLETENTTDTIEVVEMKMKTIYDTLLKVWETNEPGLFKPFHEIDFEN